ncbi:stage V sporulation protein AC [Thermolongibacillus altinsuensis]|jgi:stage V sporulation protein AC|uniref:Stage V sporulation protein AC n=1 Tax=Thermolongibacillus altinsuensis TaxID=575256 RepID=A0A4R1QHP1_9BACL|nr:SpoVA/SpoVAEb family sporulation membrane protein [Thermolongibacillus altinsuensis]TCL53079.1 stage V sporulation protein AC [Thermolongibacillus altinsuensis]GMB07781.1 stage V sporulation protein AC [Thermolongibacillus altinsuensis]
MQKKTYESIAQPFQPSVPYVMNAMKAFIVGGLICLFAQLLMDAYRFFFSMEGEQAVRWVNGTLMVAAALFTPSGFYRKMTQFSGAGALVPMTSLANIWTSSALEYRKEGLSEHVFHVGGSIVVTAVVATYIASLFL